MGLGERSDVTQEEIQAELTALDIEYANAKVSLDSALKQQRSEKMKAMRDNYLDRRRKLKRLLDVVEAEQKSLFPVTKREAEDD